MRYLTWRLAGGKRAQINDKLTSARFRSNYGTGYIALVCGHYTTPEASQQNNRSVLGGNKHRSQHWCEICLGWRREKKS